MRRRAEIDPELSTLKSVVAACDGRERQTLEGARFNVFAAFEARDPVLARRWATALRAALLSLETIEGLEQMQRLGLDALAAIERAIDA